MASYSDARGAVLAVDALRRRGFEPDAVAVQPGEMELASSVLRRPRRLPEWFLPSLAGVAAFVAAVASVDAVLAGVLLATIGAVVAAMLARGIDLGARRWSDRRFARAARTVAAERFDVVVTDADEEAEHLLASWSDPDATPVPTEGRTGR